MIEDNHLVDGELPDRIVQVLPVTENPGWVRDPNHVAFFKLENTYDRFVLPTKKKGAFKNALTKEEKTLLEGILGEGMDLGVYKKYGKLSFWSDFVVKLDKYGLRLDLSDPMDYLSYKVLLMNSSLIAPSYEKRLTHATFKYYISDGKAESAEIQKQVNLTGKAFTTYGKMSQSKVKLSAFLKVYELATRNIALKIDENSTVDFLSEQVSLIVNANPKKFLEFVEDQMFDIRLLIAEAISVGAVTNSSDRGLNTVDGVPLGRNLSQAVAFLNMEANSDILFAIQAKVKKK